MLWYVKNVEWVQAVVHCVKSETLRPAHVDFFCFFYRSYYVWPQDISWWLNTHQYSILIGGIIFLRDFNTLNKQIRWRRDASQAKLCYSECSTNMKGHLLCRLHLPYITCHLSCPAACPKWWTWPSCQRGTLICDPTDPPLPVKLHPILTVSPHFGPQEPGLHRKSSSLQIPPQSGKTCSHPNLSKGWNIFSAWDKRDNWIYWSNVTDGSDLKPLVKIYHIWSLIQRMWSGIKD